MDLHRTANRNKVRTFFFEENPCENAKPEVCRFLQARTYSKVSSRSPGTLQMSVHLCVLGAAGKLNSISVRPRKPDRKPWWGRLRLACKWHCKSCVWFAKKQVRIELSYPDQRYVVQIVVTLHSSREKTKNAQARMFLLGEDVQSKTRFLIMHATLINSNWCTVKGDGRKFWSCLFQMFSDPVHSFFHKILQNWLLFLCSQIGFCICRPICDALSKETPIPWSHKVSTDDTKRSATKSWAKPLWHLICWGTTPNKVQNKARILLLTCQKATILWKRRSPWIYLGNRQGSQPETNPLLSRMILDRVPGYRTNLCRPR